MKNVLKRTLAILLMLTTIICTSNVMALAEEVRDEIVNNGVVIKMSSKKEKVKTGELHKITIKSSYANPNDKDYATCKIYLTDENGKPNDVAKLQGLVDNKIIFACQNNSDLSVTVEQKEERDEKGKLTKKYLEYILPPGTSVEMELEFLAKNGIAGPLETLVLTEEVKHTDGTNDKLDKPLQVKWESDFNWKNLSKTADVSEVGINKENKIAQEINYSFSAENDSKDKGNIWAEKVKVIDTLSLPEGVNLPENITYDNGNIYTNGELLYSVTLPNEYLGTYEITKINANNGKITCELTIINPNIKDGELTKDFNPINDLNVTLYAQNLAIAENYKSSGEDKIENSIQAVIYPCTETNEITLEASKDVIITEDTEEVTLEKKASKNTVEIGENIDYAVTIKNNSRTPVTKLFQDDLPEKIKLTDESISKLRNEGFTVSNEVPHTISKEITLNANEEVKILYAVTVVPGTGGSIINTAQYGDITARTNVRIKSSVDGITLNKEITSRIVGYGIHGYKGDSNDGEKNGYKITSGDKLNILGEADLIEYTITLKNDSDIEKIFCLTDYYPAASNKDVLNGYSAYMQELLKYGMMGEEEFSSYSACCNNYTDFYNNGYKLYERAPFFAVVVTIPANTELKQTYILEMPKAVSSGEKYEKSYDKYLDIMRYNAGYGPGGSVNATQKYQLPRNYVQISDEPSINAVVYHKIPERFFVQKGVLSRNKYNDMIQGKATIDTRTKLLREFEKSNSEVVTFYAYFVNDSIYSLDMSKTKIKDVLPQGYEFIGFNNIDKTGSGVTPFNGILSAPILNGSITYSKNSFNEGLFWVSDFRTTGPWLDYAVDKDKSSYPLNQRDESKTITWTCTKEDDSVEFKATGTLKPSEGCYIVYSCRVNKELSATSDSSKQSKSNYISWNFPEENGFGKIKESSAIYARTRWYHQTDRYCNETSNVKCKRWRV